MRENVGHSDQIMRSFAGPLLLVFGYSALGGKYGRVPGLATMIAGAMVTETAITRTCPLNALLGIDTTRMDEPARYELEQPPYGDEILEQVQG